MHDAPWCVAGLEFKWCEGHSHVLEADLPIHSPIACKLVVRGENNAATWEPGKLRSRSAVVRQDR